MINSYEKEKLSSLLKDFYVAIGMRISVFDDQFRLITEYPQHPPELCAMIRSTEKGFAACKKCDEEAFLRARKMHTAHSYVCHAGLTEAITPILLDREVMGYAIFAHLLPAENYREHVDEICKRCKDYCDSEEKIRSAVSKLKKYSGQKITSSMRILEAIASFLQISNVINWKNEDIAFNINDFISRNLAQKLSSDVICNHFFISRTRLYQISEKAFGMGIAQYVTYKRIEEAKRLLANELTSVSKIAVQVGIGDYNYFCKLFRKNVGLSPGKYRLSVRLGNQNRHT